MIPESQITILEQLKEKTTDEVKALYQKWLNGNPWRGVNAYSDDGEIDGTAFFNDWRETNKQSEKGWDSTTYYSNFINGDRHFFPQSQYVVAYIKNKLNAEWKEVEGYNDVNSLINIDNLGKIDPWTLKNCKIKYEQDLKRAKKKKEHLQNIIDNIKENLQLCSLLNNECEEYWQGWNLYRDIWSDDITNYKKLWEQIITDAKNKDNELEPEKEPEQEPEPIKELAQPNEVSSISQPNNVLSDSQENTFQSVSTNNENQNDVSVNTTRTRIYEYISSTIKLDEMSINLIDNIDSDAAIDSSTKQHIDSAGNNLSTIPFKTEGNRSPNKILLTGFAYPLLRINDHYYGENDIKYFSIESVGFIPTIQVTLECVFNDILKGNQIKDGDKCSVFINPNHGTIKSYRGDFQITHVSIPEMDQFHIQNKIKIKFIGELFIPSLYDATQTFSFSGSSRDALIDIAQKLGLGFFFSDPENTTDTQMWYSMSDGEQKNDYINSSPAIEYIKNTALHAYKNFESFYDCWIDPRYAISFINVAQILGGSGLDEPIDIAVYNKVMSTGIGVDGENREESSEKKSKSPQPQMKLLTNITQEEDALTSFLVTKYSEKISGSINNKLGLQTKNYYNIKNSGITQVSDNSIEMNLSIPVNADKLKHGFYIMAGPGQNLTYTEGYNGSFNDQHISIQGGQIAESQSDGDAQNIVESGNNMLASGNTNKFYETAEGHNTLCNAWLKKKMICVTLNGCNMQIMRGERIPMILKDNFQVMNSYMAANDNDQMIHQKIMMSGTGWFIIKDIKWIYDVATKSNHGTCWRTELTLTRREWPIPGYIKNGGAEAEAEKTTDDAIIVNNDITTGSIKESIKESLDDINAGNAQNDKSGELTTNGLQPYMKQIYNDIVNACALNGTKIKLISGRRWFLDDNNNIVDQPSVQDGTLWKFKNANGDIVWYSSVTSPHNTGDAIDIINDAGSKYNDIIINILSDQKTLYDMITHGVYLGQETAKDDTGNTIKHYHIGKPDKSNSETYTTQNAWWMQVVMPQSNSISYNGETVQVAQYLKYSNK